MIRKSKKIVGSVVALAMVGSMGQADFAKCQSMEVSDSMGIGEATVSSETTSSIGVGSEPVVLPTVSYVDGSGSSTAWATPSISYGNAGSIGGPVSAPSLPIGNIGDVVVPPATPSISYGEPGVAEGGGSNPVQPCTAVPLPDSSVSSGSTSGSASSGENVAYPAYHPFLQWEQKGYPEYVGGYSSSDGSLKNFNVYLTENTEEKQQEIRQLVSEEIGVQFFPCQYSHSELEQVMKQISQDWKEGYGIVGWGYTIEKEKNEPRIWVGILEESYENTKEKLTETFGEAVYTTVCGYAIPVIGTVPVEEVLVGGPAADPSNGMQVPAVGNATQTPGSNLVEQNTQVPTTTPLVTATPIATAQPQNTSGNTTGAAKENASVAANLKQKVQIIGSEKPKGMKATIKNGTILLQWKANAKVGKYKIQYASNKNFANKKSVTLTGKTTKVSIKNSGAKCFVRIRTYDKNTKKWGNWQKTIQLKVVE